MSFSRLGFLCFLIGFSFVSCGVSSKTPLEKVKPKPRIAVIVDPGHGGEDFGAHSHSLPRYHEKALNLATAQLVKQYLFDLGYNPIMTRTEDRTVPLKERAQFANSRNAAAFVSVHYNSAPSRKAEGVEVYYYRNDDNAFRKENSLKLAQHVMQRITIDPAPKARGVKHGNFLVIRETTAMPAAILVECGFVTNDKEMAKIKDPSYMKQLAWAIAQGVDDFLGNQ